MTITPAVLIASSGLINGQGLAISANMTSAISTVQANSLAGNVIYLSLANVQANVSGLSTTVNSLPIFLSNLGGTISNINAQASLMLPSVQSFINLYSNVSSFAGISSEFAAGLQQFGNISFGNLGIGVTNFNDLLSQGVTSISPSIRKAVTAKTTYAQILSSISQGLLNFGSLYNFTSLQTLGPKNLVASLQSQGLTTNNGIDNNIVVAGYDPTNLSAIPDSILLDIFSYVQGSDLQRIITLTNATVLNNVNSLVDLLNVNNIMPSLACTALNINSNGDLSTLANALLNLGVKASNLEYSEFIGNIQSPFFGNLSNISQPVPTTVTSSLSAQIGSGGGLFGNPLITDLIGTVAGNTHTQSFTSINNSLISILSTSSGQQLNSAVANLVAAYNTNTGVSGALSSLNSAISTFNSQVSSFTINSANAALVASQRQLARELTNLSLAGITLPATGSTSVSAILSFTNSLAGYGIDNLHLGHVNVLANVAANNLTGDAIKAALLESNNLALASAIGKKTPSVSNQSVQIARAT
jgi:hypothetical protein